MVGVPESDKLQLQEAVKKEGMQLSVLHELCIREEIIFNKKTKINKKDHAKIAD